MQLCLKLCNKFIKGFAWTWNYLPDNLVQLFLLAIFKMRIRRMRTRIWRMRRTWRTQRIWRIRRIWRIQRIRRIQRIWRIGILIHI